MNELETLKHLFDEWPAKLLAACVGILFSELFQLHIHLLMLFALLEFVDCATKWMALSCLRIKDKNADANPTLWECIKGIRAAHRAKYIKSQAMREQFGDKMITYLILIIAAGIGDYVIKMIGKPDLLLSIVVTYISVTELLSVLENLGDAGVSMAASLLVLVKKKTQIGGDDNDGKK